MSLTNCVYRFLNQEGEIIYIGKASQLRERLWTHHHLPNSCYQERERIEFLSFSTKDDMELAEMYLIAKHRPKYNSVGISKRLTLQIPALETVKWHPYRPKKNSSDLINFVNDATESLIFKEESESPLSVFEYKIAEIDKKIAYALDKLKTSEEAKMMAQKGYYLTQIEGQSVEVYAKKTTYGYKILTSQSLDYATYYHYKLASLKDKAHLIKAQEEYIEKQFYRKNQALTAASKQRFLELKATDLEDFKDKCIQSIADKFYQIAEEEVEVQGYYDVNYLQVETFDELYGSKLCHVDWLFPNDPDAKEKVSQLADEVASKIEKQLAEKYGEFQEDFTLEWREENYRNLKEFQFPVWIKKVIKTEECVESI